MLPRTHVNRGGGICQRFWRKKGLQARLPEAACPLPPLNYGEAITEYTPRRIPESSVLPKLELDEGELVA